MNGDRGRTTTLAALRRWWVYRGRLAATNIGGAHKTSVEILVGAADSGAGNYSSQSPKVQAINTNVTPVTPREGHRIWRRLLRDKAKTAKSYATVAATKRKYTKPSWNAESELVSWVCVGRDMCQPTFADPVFGSERPFGEDGKRSERHIMKPIIQFLI